MTKNEAIEKLRAYHKCQKMQVKGIYEDCNARLCDNCDLCYAQGNTGEHIKSIEIAIQALEKQIPKKPIMKQYFKDMEEKYLCCPTCGEILTDRIPGDNKTFYFHCMNCGQKFDWSDEE
jgi:ferredoxin